MNISLCQLNFIVGDIQGNTKKILDSIAQCKTEGANLIVFSELAISGYPPQDLLEYPSFIDKCIVGIEEIKKETQGICVIIGAPYYVIQSGKNFYNSAYVLSNGKCIKHYYKWLLPTYDVFDENRYFEVGSTSPVFEYKNKKIGITICEDIWDIKEDKQYQKAPLDSVSDDLDLIVNISASPYDFNHYKKRLEVVQETAQRKKAPVVYVNQIGANTSLIFDGGSMLVNKDGKLVERLKFFEEEIKTIKLPLTYNTAQSITVPNKLESIHNALVLGIKDYFKKLGFQKAVLGLSGGIDSAMVNYLAVRALGKENVLSVLMPSPYSSDHSIKDSEELCKRLENDYEIISINHLFDTFQKTLQPQFEGLSFNVAEENIQARIRGTLLMALSNKFGYILLNTTNKSEAAVGYGTLYGDMCGGIAVLADIYKTELYELANWVNKTEEIIPKNIIHKEPSAELRPDQKDTDSLPEYKVLDKILYYYIECKLGEKDIAQKGFDLETVKRIIKLVNQNEYKRFQMAPVLRISTKAFGYSRRMPLVAKFLS